MKVISIINLKGGVAKTISAANMAHILSTVHKKRVLLVDNDKQGNISKMFGLHDYAADSISEVLTVRGVNLDKIIKPTQFPNLDVMPANMSLISANHKVALDMIRPKQTRFRAAFKSIADKYDYCIIDNAPDINMSTANALVASDDVIIPIKIDRFAFDGLAELKERIDEIRWEHNPGLKVRGCLITIYQKNESNKQREEWLRGQNIFPVFNTKIRRTEKVNESTFEGDAQSPILAYSPRCGAAQDYLAFVEEYLRIKAEERNDKNEL